MQGVITSGGENEELRVLEAEDRMGVSGAASFEAVHARRVVMKPPVLVNRS